MSAHPKYPQREAESEVLFFGSIDLKSTMPDLTHQAKCLTRIEGWIITADLFAFQQTELTINQPACLFVL